MVIDVRSSELIEATPESVGMSSRRLGEVSRIVQGYVNDGKFPGAISVVARCGKVVHFETCGSMDDEAGKVMAPDAIFRLASMTKPIVSLALMTLYEEARFQLDTPVSDFIPEFKDLTVFAGGTAESPRVRKPSRAMTVRDILTHTSGLTAAGADTPVGQLYQREGILSMRTPSGTLADMVAKVAKVPLLCDPGAAWNYGISTDVVGYLCEIISGQPLDRFLAARIFEPLSMRDTGFHVPESELPRFAAGYTFNATTRPRYALSDPLDQSPFARPRTYFSGAGGLVGTAADYIRFCKMLAAGGMLDGERIIGRRTLQYMTVNHLPDGREVESMRQSGPTEGTAPGVGFGLGFAVLMDPVRAQTLGTAGEYYWGGAYSTAFFVSPAEDLFLIFMTQVTPSSSYPIRRELRIATYQSIDE